MIHARGSLCGCLTLAFALTSAALAESQPYTFVLLDAPGSLTYGFPADINDAGVVIIRRAGGAYTWTHDAGEQPLTTDPSVTSRFPAPHPFPFAPRWALQINNSGTVLGVGCPNVCPNPPEVPATWNETEGLVFLPLDSASAINNHGTIVGKVGSDPVILRPGQSPQIIPLTGTAVDVNDSELVTGTLASHDAYVWVRGLGPLVIPRLPGRTDAHWRYWARAINNQHQVVGEFWHPFILGDMDSNKIGLFLWSPSAGTADLRFPYGDEAYFDAVDINDRGHIIATVDCDGPGCPDPYLYKNGIWTRVASFVPVGSAYTPERVYSMNNNGWMTGPAHDWFYGSCWDLFDCPGYVLMQPSVSVSANGVDEYVSLTAGDPLKLDFTFETHGTGAVDPGEVYVGVVTLLGVFWLGPGGLQASPVPVYTGPVSDFAFTLLDLPAAGVFPTGVYMWFMIVDNDADAVPKGDLVDSIVVVVDR